MKIDNNNVEWNGTYAYAGGNATTVQQLGGVCTGRLMQGLFGSKGDVVERVKAWIEWLNQDYDAMSVQHQNTNWCHLVYKPQLLVSVTNASQKSAESALREVGFIPSPQVKNEKYGEGYELTTWTYALNGFASQEDAKELTSAD